MPAQLVLVHDDPAFTDQCANALRNAGYEVAAFTDPMLALDALDAARTVELLITRIVFTPGKPNGISLANMARLRRRQIRVLFMALPEYQHHVRDWGEHLPLPATPEELVEAAHKVLAKAPLQPSLSSPHASQ